MDILTGVAITVVAGIVLLFIEYNFFQRQGQISILAKLWYFATLPARRILDFTKKIWYWVVAHWQLIAGLTLIIGAAFGSYLISGSIVSAVALLSLVVGMILLGKWRQMGQRRQFITVTLPLGSVVNASINDKYRDLPRGEVGWGGVKFDLSPKGYAFDTSEARVIESDGTIKTELKLPQPAAGVTAVHVLINAGGAFRFVQGSEMGLEWLKIGRIRVVFDDQTYQDTELVLGGNIREWAVGNAPGKLVDRVDDPGSKLAWRGINNSGLCAVIDRLEIPIGAFSLKKKVTSIVFIRDIPDRAPASQGGNIHFFVSAVTLESRP